MHGPRRSAARTLAAAAALALPGFAALALVGCTKEDPMDYVTVEDFGSTKDGTPVREFTVRSPNGRLVARFTDYGATVLGLDVPDADGNVVDVCNGFDDITGYQSDANQYFGCTVGRVCNRIAGGKFELDGQQYTLATNDGANHLHGGVEESFDKLVWKADVQMQDGAPAIRFTHTSPDGSEGYPGEVQASVRYVLRDDALRIEMAAGVDQRTPVNMTNHAYWNLGGHGSGEIADHELRIAASRYTVLDPTGIPTGEVADVEGTVFDFREAKPIGKDLPQLVDSPWLGFDHNWVVDEPAPADLSPRYMATLRDPASGRTLEVWSTQPGLQFYSGNYLKGQKGKDGKTYELRTALCLEPQHFPDSVNHPDFPSTIVKPGVSYRQTIEYRFPAP